MVMMTPSALSAGHVKSPTVRPGSFGRVSVRPWTEGAGMKKDWGARGGVGPELAWAPRHLGHSPDRLRLTTSLMNSLYRSLIGRSSSTLRRCRTAVTASPVCGLVAALV